MHHISRFLIIVGTALFVAAAGSLASLKSAFDTQAEAADAPVQRMEPNRGGTIDRTTENPAEALKRFTLAEGYEISLFASEKDFPIADPVAINFDARGRLWVSTSPTYPHYVPGIEPDDKLVILEDSDRDGRADKHTVFADKLYLAIGFELGDGGAYISQQPNLMFAKDTSGDDVADVRETVLHGFGTEDSHHAIHNFTWDSGGALHFGEGTFHHSQVETPHGPVRLEEAGIFRYEPRRQKLEAFVSYPFANPWGHTFDRWGQNFIADASGGSNYFALPITGHVDYPRKHPPMQEFTLTKVRPTCGCVLVSSRHFPDSAQGNFLVNNCIGFQGIKQYQVVEKESGFEGREIEPLLFSSDPNFRPVDIKFGPDGALYIADWFNPLIGHMQYSLRDPNRDHSHGRIWRITYKGRPLVEPAQIAGQSIPALLDLLKTYEDGTRYRVRRELRERDSAEVVAAVKQWIAGLDQADPEYQHHLLEALWVYQGAQVVEPELLQRLLRSPDYRARAAATRVLRHWRDRVQNPLALLQTQVNDEHPRVRLEAVIALSYFPSAEAAEIALEALNHPLDYYLSYGLKETISTLAPHWKPVIAAGKPFSEKNRAGADYVLAEATTTDELGKMQRSPAVCNALLSRPGVLQESRKNALRELARVNNTGEMTELLAAIRRVDEKEADGREFVLQDLAQMLAARSGKEIAEARAAIETLSRSGRTPLARQIAYAAIVAADNSPQRAWQQASQSAGSLIDLLNALPRVADPELRAAFYPLVDPLVHGDVKAADTATVRRAAIQASTYLAGHEAETFKLLAALFKAGDERAAAIAALHRIPKPAIPAEDVRPLVDSILTYVERLPTEKRTEPVTVEALQLGGELAALLPGDQANDVRQALRKLGVPVIVMRTPAHKMVFDRTKIFVEAGKPVQLVLENTDIMPHNLIITAPGGLMEIGLAAEKMATSPDAYAQQFVPKSSKVLQATRLLGPGESQRLQFTAPTQTGEYPYLCTFPGHWRTMYGVMHVVASLDSIPQEELESPQLVEGAGAPRRPFVKNWTVEDLAGELDEVDRNRSTERGKELFTAAACNACHSMSGTGGQAGPDLTDVSQRFKRPDLLREIIEPSHVINEKFQTQVVQTVDGEVVSGLVVAQNDEMVRIMPSPLEKCEPREILLDDIEDQKQSTVSLMPAGLLTTFSKEEIFDLLAYLESGSVKK